MFQASQDFKLVLTMLFKTIWQLATSFNIPGTNINAVEFSFAAVVIVFALRRGLRVIFGAVVDADSLSRRDDK